MRLAKCLIVVSTGLLAIATTGYADPVDMAESAYQVNERTLNECRIRAIAEYESCSEVARLEIRDNIDNRITDLVQLQSILDPEALQKLNATYVQSLDTPPLTRSSETVIDLLEQIYWLEESAVALSPEYAGIVNGHRWLEDNGAGLDPHAGHGH